MSVREHTVLGQQKEKGIKQSIEELWHSWVVFRSISLLDRILLLSENAPSSILVFRTSSATSAGH